MWTNCKWLMAAAVVIVSGHAVADHDEAGFRGADGVFAGPATNAMPEPAGERSLRGMESGGDENCARHVPGLLNPGAIIRHGDLLYVANNHNQNTNLITVLDISTSGEEQIVKTIDTPVNPVDIAIAGDELYVIDQTRDSLHWRPLDEDSWDSIDLPNAQTTEWEYGNIMYAHDGRMFVLHFWENLISVVDLETKTVIDTIDDLSFLPNRIVFLEEVMIVLSVGLAAPSCAADGPHFSVFDLKTLKKEDSHDLSGDCVRTCGLFGDRFYVVYDNSIREFDIESGTELNSLSAPPSFGRHMAIDHDWLYVQRPGGDIDRVAPDLPELEHLCNVLAGSQTWFPPIEQMVLDGSAARLFITNRNDNTVSILDLDPSKCPADFTGDGQVGVSDLLVLIGAWGPCPDQGSCPADLTGDGAVGVADLLVLIGSWGPCP